VTSNCRILSDKVVATLTGLIGVRHTAKNLRIAYVRAEMGTMECPSTSQKLPTNIHMHVSIYVYVCVCMYLCVCIYVCMCVYV
jgi:hypothetical protein